MKLYSLLEKFNGRTTVRDRLHRRVTPRYMIFHMRRFTRNSHFVERMTPLEFPMEGKLTATAAQRLLMQQKRRFSSRYDLIMLRTEAQASD